jgi:(heptosyl)LPS beta-1,4-glucosyltransferase
MNRILPLTVVITTFNSERTLERVLQSVSTWVAEIIIVDSGSTDGSCRIAEKYSCLVIPETWHGYGANKNIGIHRASQDWILSIDSDEVISPRLKSYLQNQWNEDIRATAYRIKIDSMVGESPIRYGSWGRVSNFRLFRKSEAVWDLSDVHEDLNFLVSPVRKLKIQAPIYHYTTPSIPAYKTKLDAYAEATAIKYIKQKKKTYPFQPWISALFLWVKEYIFLGGFLDGILGWQLAILRAKTNYAKYKLFQSKLKNA